MIDRASFVWIGMLAGSVSLGAGPNTLDELVSLNDTELAEVDVVRMNLAVAQGLDDSIDIEKYERHVDQIAERIRLNIERNESFFESNRKMFGGSRSKWVCVMIWQVLSEDFGIRYLAGKNDALDHSQLWQKFLHGLLDRKQGTCCTLPVLYVAIGQRLGYPIRGVETTTHMFCRWEGPGGAVFNIETTSDRGMTFPSDDKIREWSNCPAESVQRGLMKSMGARELLGHFLLLRSDTHIATEDWPAASADLRTALTLYPNNPIMANNLGLVSQHHTARDTPQAQAEPSR